MSDKPLLVTGAAGQLGRRVVQLLLDRKVGPVVAATRTPDRLTDLGAHGVSVVHADFDDEASLERAFDGCARALLISTDAVAGPGRRLAQHRRAIRALAGAGVGHVVYTSMIKPEGSPVLLAPDHLGTELALADTGIPLTVLRNNVYTDTLLAGLPGVRATGQLVDARDNGAIAYVTREDCAQAAAAALADFSATTSRTLDVTGPEAVTGEGLAAMLTTALERPVRYVSVSFEELVAGLVQHGLPEPLARIYASFDLAAARGDLAGVTHTVARLTGKPPTGVADFLRSSLSATAR